MGGDEIPDDGSNIYPTRKTAGYVRKLTNLRILHEKLIEAYAENKMLKQELKKRRVLRFVNISENTQEKLLAHNTSPRVLFPDEITLDRVRTLALVHATETMFAGVLGVSNNTWKNFVQDFPEVRQVIESANAEGKLSLRVKTVDMALDGNWNALQHLNKHILGEHDKSTQDVNVNVRRDALAMTDDYVDVESLPSNGGKRLDDGSE